MSNKIILFTLFRDLCKHRFEKLKKIQLNKPEKSFIKPAGFFKKSGFWGTLRDSEDIFFFAI